MRNWRTNCAVRSARPCWKVGKMFTEKESRGDDTNRLLEDEEQGEQPTAFESFALGLALLGAFAAFVLLVLLAIHLVRVFLEGRYG